MRLRCLLLFLLAFSTSVAAEEPLPVSGPFEQGGALVGRGHFLLAFDCAAPPAADIQILKPDGSRLNRVVAVAPRRYRTQRINGLPQSKVVPPEAVWDRIIAEREQLIALRAQSRPDTDYLSGFATVGSGTIKTICIYTIRIIPVLEA